MKEFVEKPRTVKAFQWTGEEADIDALQLFLGADSVNLEYKAGQYYAIIGKYPIAPGEWIVSNDGYLSRLSDEKFKERYQPV
jgi:hypothetical protein